MALDPEQLAHLKLALGQRYQIQRKLGAGGMASVYLAEEPRHARHVALKVLHPHLAVTLGTDRFLREIKLTANLTHPHILPLFDSGEAGGFLFYTMPYVEGESLRNLLNREGQLSIMEALRITNEIADALGFAHTHNVVHRDIKPENVLLEAGHAVVSDFGIAKAVTEAGGEDLTATGLALGTAQYMSPEQAAGSTRLDGRSDMYSLGCVLYEMLAGTPPFMGSREVIFARKTFDNVPPIRTVRNTISPAVDEAVARSLAKVPADRFRTMQEFIDALTTPRPVSRGAGSHTRVPMPRGQEDRDTTMPLLVKPLLDELDVFGVTHPGKLGHRNDGHFLISSIGRYMSVHQTSLPDETPLPRMGERQAFLVMIASGVGRGSWGQEVSRSALEVLAHYMVHSMRCYNTGDESHDQALVEAIREAANQCHANIAQKARENPGGGGMAAAFSMYVGCWPRAYLLQAGNTRCYRFHEGKLAQVTKPDVGVHVYGQAGSPESEALASGVTMSGAITPIVYRLGLAWGTVVLLCTEELTKHVVDEQIRERLSAITSSEQACQDLVHDALAGGATDSITVVVGRARPIVRQQA
jgi:serine/threonine protein kinase